MTPLEAVLPAVVVGVVVHWLIRRHLANLADPAYLRRKGIVIVSAAAIQDRADPLGSYKGRRIWGRVTFKGIVYRFDHIARPREREQIGPGQLYLEPGLVYVTG